MAINEPPALTSLLVLRPACPLRRGMSELEAAGAMPTPAERHRTKCNTGLAFEFDGSLWRLWFVSDELQQFELRRRQCDPASEVGVAPGRWFEQVSELIDGNLVRCSKEFKLQEAGDFELWTSTSPEWSWCEALLDGPTIAGFTFGWT